MKLQDLKVKTILILGFGREGKATLNFLNKHFPEKEIALADQSDGDNYLDKINDFDVIIKSPGIPFLPEIQKAKDEGKIITSATEIFFDNCKGQIVGVTGSKGKSTTSSLIYEVLKKGGLDVYLVGNIGIPALEVLDQGDENSIFVYELSSFQLENLKKSPHIAVITNIYPEHLDHHGSFGAYKDAKANIVKYQNENDYVIFNKDNKECKDMAELSDAKNKYGYSDQPPFSKDIAIYIGKLFNISDQNIKQAIDNFKTLPHRLEYIGEFKGIKFYNDSLATIPQATIRALKVLGANVQTLIAGGFDRGVDYSILGSIIMKSEIKNLILFPTTGEKIGKLVGDKIKKFKVDNMKDAARIAFEQTNPGKIVLLSPASSSFNLFRDYEDRGNQFKGFVSSLGARN